MGRQRLDQARVAEDVLDSLLEGCQVIGTDWTYLYVNAAAARQGGKPRDELIGRTMLACYPGIDSTPMFGVLRACMVDRTHHMLENEFTFPDGSVGWFELRFLPVPEGVCILSVDVTDQKRSQAALARTEAQLRQTQKMDAIGRLAGGVAHDFNNLLSVILSYAEIAREECGPGHAASDDIDQITAAGRRAADLTKQLLTLSRNQTSDRRRVDLNEHANAVVKMLPAVLPDAIQLRVVNGANLPPILADPGQLEQIAMNLAMNARDAMPAGGTLTIETASVDLDEAYARAHHGVAAGRYVMLAVSDTGTGMDKETQLRIFEPFFTTKGKGRGTGLGLSIVYGIVQQNAGSIWFYSEPGHGTTFKIYFPIAGEVAAPPPADTAARSRTGRSTGTILVVEDEAQLRKLVAAILERDGYEVLAAATPQEALEIMARRGKDVDLFFTDLVMPGMHGRELARRVTADFPELSTLFMSGFTDDSALREGGPVAASRFVQKPFTPDRLLQAVREAMRNDRGGAGS
jgi:PAS domain S-box-containing protein